MIKVSHPITFLKIFRVYHIELLTKMASNSEYLTDEDNSCKLCQLSGPFERNNRGDDPIEEIVKAVGGKFLPWDGEPRVASEFELTAFCSQMCGQWQQESVINIAFPEVFAVRLPPKL